MMSFGASCHAADADLILHDGKVVTVDERFSFTKPWPCGPGELCKWGGALSS